jgi:conjugal transfer pilus assembly protein TraE
LSSTCRRRHIDWKRNVLLNYVAPDRHAAMKTQMDLEADRLRSNNASTSFLIQQLTANDKDQSVLVIGRLRRQINGTDVGEPETRLPAQFEYTGGRVHVRTFKEVPYVQPGHQTRLGAADPRAVVR